MFCTEQLFPSGIRKERMKSKMRKTVVTLLAVLLAVIIPFSVLFETTVASAASTPLSLSATSFSGKKVDSSLFAKYDLIMLNYWAEWCGPCVSELPALQKISKNYSNVLVIGIWWGSNKTSAKSTLKSAGVTYQVIDINSSLYQYLAYDSSDQTYYIPQTVFFDNKGNQLGSAYVGGRSYDSWASVVNKKLSQIPKPATVKKPTISKQPVKSVNVKTGTKVNITVKAKGKKLTYQWYYRKTANSKWKKITSGGKSATLSFTAKTKISGYQYRCLVRNSAGEVYTRVTKLKVTKK